MGGNGKHLLSVTSYAAHITDADGLPQFCMLSGFYPAGGGRWLADIQPCQRLHPLTLCERGRLLEYQAQALLARLPDHIAQRELQTVAALLAWEPASLRTVAVSAVSPGNCLTLILRSEPVTEVFTGFGRRDVRAEQVATEAIEPVRRYLAASVPVTPGPGRWRRIPHAAPQPAYADPADHDPAVPARNR